MIEIQVNEPIIIEEREVVSSADSARPSSNGKASDGKAPTEAPAFSEVESLSCQSIAATDEKRKPKKDNKPLNVVKN